MWNMSLTDKENPSVLGKSNACAHEALFTQSILLYLDTKEAQCQLLRTQTSKPRQCSVSIPAGNINVKRKVEQKRAQQSMRGPMAET